VGTGDGRAVLRRAARQPNAFVVGLDANASRMREASRRTSVARAGGLSNAAFVVAAAEAIPAPLVGRADLVTVLFPWGSLLRGVVGVDRAALFGVASLLRGAGRLEALVSVIATDGPAPGVDPERVVDRAAIATAWLDLGVELTELRQATDAELAESGSSWSRRLRANPSRAIVRLSGVRHGRAL
jgi:16S rRNA (adenine(1408)-N(1))-methyltransferase